MQARIARQQQQQEGSGVKQFNISELLAMQKQPQDNGKKPGLSGGVPAHLQSIIKHQEEAPAKPPPKPSRPGAAFLQQRAADAPLVSSSSAPKAQPAAPEADSWGNSAEASQGWSDSWGANSGGSGAYGSSSQSHNSKGGGAKVSYGQHSAQNAGGFPGGGKGN